MTRVLLGLFLLAAAALPARAGSLACMGDSITVGVRPAGVLGPAVVAGQEFCALLANGRTVLNRGGSGNTSTQMASRFASDVVAAAPSCVLIQAGANDAPSYVYPTGQVSAADFKANLAAMVSQAQAAGIAVTLMTPWVMRNGTWNWNITPYLQAVRDLGKSMGVPVIDIYDRFAELNWTSTGPGFSNTYDPGSYFNDYVHPAPAGHAEIAGLCREPRYAGSCACSP